jgi:flagellar biosynthesis protein FlhF
MPDPSGDAAVQIQSFEAETMPQALDKVRNMMGDQALIVRSRKVRKGGIFGLATRQHVEVCAAVDQTQTQPAVVPHRPAAPDTDHIVARLEALDTKLETLLLGLGVGSIAAPDINDANRQMMAGTPATADPSVLRELAGRLPYCGGIDVNEGSITAAIVGATGVGKTTALLKLAGQFSLFYQKRVALVTADTFRLGAVEQLKAFARIVGCELRVVLSPEEMAQTVQALQDRDLILVDTPGGSQRNQLHQSQVQAFLQAAEPDQVHLVLPATARPDILKECISCFAGLGADRLILAKLDEASYLAEICAATLGSGLPLSYLSFGQRIPEDLEEAREEVLAEIMVKGNCNSIVTSANERALTSGLPIQPSEN